MLVHSSNIQSKFLLKANSFKSYALHTEIPCLHGIQDEPL